MTGTTQAPTVRQDAVVEVLHRPGMDELHVVQHLAHGGRGAAQVLRDLEHPVDGIGGVEGAALGGRLLVSFRSGEPVRADAHALAAGAGGGGPILGFRLNVGNELGMLSLTGDAEMLEDYVRYSLLLRASFRF